MIGVDQYRRLNPLKYCCNDVRDLSAAFVASLDFEESHIFRFSAGEARKPELSDIWHQLGELRHGGKIGANDLLVFFFSGHGMIDKSDGRDYLLPMDASQHYLSHTALAVKDVAQALLDTGCKNVVMFLDACRLVAEGVKKGDSSSAGEPGIGPDTKTALERSGILTFFSCGPQDASWQLDDLEQSSFTSCLLAAIETGACDTASRLDKYLRDNVPVLNQKRNRPPQLPYSFWQPAEKGALPIFFSRAQREREETELEAMTDALGELWVNAEISEELYREVLDVLGGIARRTIKDPRALTAVRAVIANPADEGGYLRPTIRAWRNRLSGSGAAGNVAAPRADLGRVAL